MEEWHFNSLLKFKKFYLHFPFFHFPRLYEHYSKGKGLSQHTLQIPVTGNFVSGKTWTNEVRSQPPISIASSSISFPLLLLLAAFIERDHQDHVGLLAELTGWFPVSCKDPARKLFRIPTYVRMLRMKTSHHSTLVRGMAPPFLAGLGQATKFCTRNLGTGLEKANFELAQVSLCMDSLTHVHGNKADTEKVRGQGAALVCSFHSTSSPLPQKNRELWVLLH